MDNNTWKPLTVNYYVYNKEGKPVDFLMKNPETGELERVASYSQDISEAGFDGLWDPDETPFRIYMDYGTVYEQTDDLFTRGNSYYIGFEIKYKVSNDPTIYSYPLANDGTSPSGFGMYEIIDTTKENPNLKMYIASSTKDSITYEYEIKDADNGIYKETGKDDYYFYYIIGNGVQQEIVMEKKNDITEFNQFEGRFTLNGLSNGIKYQLYYKKNHQKTGNITDDVISYLDGSTNTRIFDGYYDASENIDAYRFQYEVINNIIDYTKKLEKKVIKNY